MGVRVQNLALVCKEIVMKKIKSIVVASLLAYGPANWATESLSLEQSVERAILSNPEVGARFHDFQSSLEGKNVARGALLPEVNASGWTGR